MASANYDSVFQGKGAVKETTRKPTAIGRTKRCSVGFDIRDEGFSSMDRLSMVSGEHTLTLFYFLE